MGLGRTFEERRLALDDKFRAMLGNSNTYFQPPKTVELKYDCVVYKRLPIETRKADNGQYTMYFPIEAQLITKDPSSELVEKLGSFPMTRQTAHYVADNLYHDVFIMYI